MLVGAWLLAQPEPLGSGPAQRCTVGRGCKGLLLGLLAGFGDMVLSKGGCRSLISHRWFSPSFLPILETLACTVWHSYVVDMMSSPLRATPSFTGIAVSCPTSPQWLTTLPPWSVAPECGHRRLCLAPPSVPWPDFCGKENHRVMVCLLFPNSHGWTSLR